MWNRSKNISIKDGDLRALKFYSCNRKISVVQFLGKFKKTLPINNFIVLRRSQGCNLRGRSLL